MKKTWHKAWIFKKRVFARIFGLPLAGVATALSLVTAPTAAFDYELAAVASPTPVTPLVMTTSTHYSFPLATTLGMSQGYHGLHPGVDLRAPYGTAVYSIDGGIVVEVEKIRVGYGHFVRIAHQGTLSSLYAHLDEVFVEPGDKVERGAQIGTVGMTGWSSGPHLHFEMHSGNKSVSPINYIGKSAI
jgi:murein DD-endopeptidase MepM/ murein hydrolase activator NlpD